LASGGFFLTTDGVVGLCAIVAAALAITTIYFTGMIYASLKPIHQWRNQWVVPNYLALGLMSGCLILDFLTRLWADRSSGVILLTVVVVLAAWWMKERYWRGIDTGSAPSTVASATALGNRGSV
jgi:sulfite dehydrogenase (quinone) subunit SoeC